MSRREAFACASFFCCSVLNRWTDNLYKRQKPFIIGPCSGFGWPQLDLG